MLGSKRHVFYGELVYVARYYVACYYVASYYIACYCIEFYRVACCAEIKLLGGTVSYIAHGMLCCAAKRAANRGSVDCSGRGGRREAAAIQL